MPHASRIFEMPGQAVSSIAALLVGGAIGCNTLLSIEEATLCGECDAGVAPLDRLRTASNTDTSVEGSASNGTAPSGALPNATASDAGSRVDSAVSCATPAPGYERDCASCGGSIACDGSCSVALAPNLGQSCGSCGGTIDCNGACSAATPSDYGSVLPRDTLASFSCCLIDEVRSYGPDGADSSGCYPGYTYDGCSVSKMSGGGSVTIVSEDAASCTCRVRVENRGLEGATYSVHVRLVRGCGPG